MYKRQVLKALILVQGYISSIGTDIDAVRESVEAAARAVEEDRRKSGASQSAETLEGFEARVGSKQIGANKDRNE